MSYRIVYKDELTHHGILGQKWGVRRYQNPDGSYTDDGKKRYGRISAVSRSARRVSSKIKNFRINKYINDDGSLTDAGKQKYGTKEQYDQHIADRNKKIKKAIVGASTFAARTALTSAAAMTLGAVGSTLLSPLLSNMQHEVNYYYYEHLNLWPD